MSIQDYQDAMNEAELIYSELEVDTAIEKMAEAIKQRLHDKNPLVLPVMIGGLILAGKLMPKLAFPLQIDYLHATRYRSQTSGAELKWLRKPEKSLNDQTILLIDDILDEGITLAAIVKYCQEAGAKEVLTAVLAEKTLDKSKPIEYADFTGLIVPNRYVFGYGMDYKEYHRNTAGIYALKNHG